MSRLFDGIDDQMDFSVGASATLPVGASTVAFLCRINSIHRGGLLDGRDSGSTRRFGVNPFDSGSVFYAVNGSTSTPYSTYEDVFVILAFTKPAGNGQTVRLHLYRYDTLSWTHSNLGTVDASSTLAGGLFRVGLFDGGQFLSANACVWGMWAGTALADGSFNGLETSLANWLAASPTTLWAFNQAAVTDPVVDLTGGGAAQTARTGTTVDAAEPPGFSYALGIDATLAGTAAAATFSASGAAFTAATLAGVVSAATLTMNATTGTNAVLAGVASAATLRLVGENDVADDCEWPVDPSCVPGWDELPEPARENGIAWASFILKSLTGNRYTLCAVTVRPCYVPCQRRTYETYGVWWDGWGTGGGGQSWVPFIDTGGEWRNCGCFGSCCCGVHCEVWLPGPISSITEVRLNNVVLDPSAYRVDNGEYLVRQDGDCWPEASNQTVPAVSTDHTFVVTYVRGEAVPRAGELAGGLLAGEFAKACAGGDCAIPERVTSISRSGVSFELVSPTDEFDQGLTGITEVDRFIRAANPGRLKERPWVSNPDLPIPRMQTWP